MKYFTGILYLLFVSCSKIDRIEPTGFELNIEADSITFAEIGDFGSAGMPEYNVSKLVKSWNPDFIISAGDNNYEDGKLETIKNNISQFYGDFIYNYDAPSKYKCNGKAFQDKVNRFFPTPGNHDAYNRNDLNPYYNFFTLPGNESYYRFFWGPVAIFSINSVGENLDKQKLWLEEEVKRTSKPFKIVFFHHPPYSSGFHGDNKYMQWPFHKMGIDLVLTGHDHIYDRVTKKDEKGLTYIVNGLGGREKFSCNSHPLSTEAFDSFCYSEDYGAIKFTATKDNLTLEFYSISKNEPVDRITISK